MSKAVEGSRENSKRIESNGWVGDRDLVGFKNRLLHSSTQLNSTQLNSAQVQA